MRIRAFTRRFRVDVVALVLFAATVPALAGDIALCREPGLNALVDAAARDALDPDRLAALAQRFETTPQDCDPIAAYCVGMKLSLVSVDRAYAALGANSDDLRTPLQHLDAGASHGNPWQLFVLRGDLQAALARREHVDAHFQEAAAALQLGLDAIAPSPLCAAFGEVRPDPDEIRRILARAREAVILAPNFDPVRTKCECGGLLRHTIAGVPVGPVPFPALFEGDTAALTDRGREALGLFLDVVKADMPARLGVVTHAETPGGDAADLSLSAARAQAVADALKAHGYAGTVDLVARGRGSPFATDDPTWVTPEEAARLNNRTEIERD